MPPRYLANPFEEEVLTAIEQFDPTAPGALEQPLLVIDARDQAENFRSRLGSRLVAALADKVRNKRIDYVSGLGEHGRRYAMQCLRERHAQLDEPTRTAAKSALANWRSLRVEIEAADEKARFVSGLGISMPVLGVTLHYDLALAMEFG